MDLYDNDYKILEYLTDLDESVAARETPYSLDDFSNLVENKCVRITDKTIQSKDGNIPVNGFIITAKGRNALDAHYSEIEYRTTSLKWTKIAGISAIVSAILGALSIMTTLLLR